MGKGMGMMRHRKGTLPDSKRPGNVSFFIIKVE